MIKRNGNYVWYEYTDSLENWVDKNDPDVQKFIASATAEQMKYFEIACKVMTVTGEIIIESCTDDIHLQNLTQYFVENKNAEFIQFLENAKTIKDYITAVQKMPFDENNKVYYTYFIDAVNAFDNGDYYYRTK